MSNKKQTRIENIGMTKTKNKLLSCSIPEHRAESPTSSDSHFLCDSDATSSDKFICTQDGTEGETDVVWNFYTPKSGHATKSRIRSSTPVSRIERIVTQETLIDKPAIKRKHTNIYKKNKELLQELVEVNQNLPELIKSKSQSKCKIEKQQSGSEEDIFSDSSEHSPKTGRKSSHCLRKNLLNSKYAKPESETETVLESDDSINECLLKASQVVEENILNCLSTHAKKTGYESNDFHMLNIVKPSLNLNYDSMDAILNSITSPNIHNIKNNDTSCLNNDSFDTIIGHLNDSALERFTQMHTNNDTSNKKKRKGENSTVWTVKELVVHDGSPSSKSVFIRHSSMPESPIPLKDTKPSTSGMVFGRYNSMPVFENNAPKCTVPGDSPIRCTPDEIKRKHQQAREKLLAKRLLPFTASQQNQSIVSQSQQNEKSKRTQFQPRVHSSMIHKLNNNGPISSNNNNSSKKSNPIQNSMNMKILIEKKRQEALMKLRRRQPQNKLL